MAARLTLRHLMLFGLTSLLVAVVTTPVRAEGSLMSVAHPMVAAPAVPCTPQTSVANGSEWFSVSSAPSSTAGTAEPALAEAAAGADEPPGGTAQYFASSLRPSSLLVDDEGAAAATLAGATLMLLGGWRWYRTTRLPWPPEPFEQDRLAMAGASQDHDAVEGWRLSRFDDLPDAAPERPLRPLYDSLDDDVIDIVPLSPRA
jgi:hypothetical protein